MKLFASEGSNMKKKLIIVSVFATLILVTISLASAINSNNENLEKDSPLYKIRTKRAIGEKISKLIDNIKTKFIGERIMFLPFGFFNILNNRANVLQIETFHSFNCFCTAKLC